MVKGITICIDGDKKIIRVRSKTFVGFIKIENDNQNVRWECAKGKYQWEKPTFPSQPNMIWIFSSFFWVLQVSMSIPKALP